jgi:hypothetical protein
MEYTMEGTSGPQTNLFRQCLIALIFALGMSAVLSCGFLAKKPMSVPGDCEAATEPTEQDVEYVLGYTGNTFESSDWQRSYTVGPDRVTVTWLNHDEGAVVFLEYLVCSCGYTQADVDDHFSEQNFEDVIFMDYENLQRIATCTDIGGDLTLHEFTAEVHETGYVIRFWIKLDSKTRVLDMMLVFPRGSEMELDKYARERFPELSSCQM